jgi:hypothetical protein
MMPVLVLVAVLATAVALGVRRGRPDGDVPARIMAAAANSLPAHRRDWGCAMIAELAQLRGPARRWRFALSALRVVLLLPPGRRRPVLATALAGLLATVAVTAAAAAEIPGLAVAAAVLGLLLCGYATARASRPGRARWTAPGVAVAALAVAGTAAVVVSVTRIVAAHPAAAADGTHLFSVLFALALASCLAVALTPTDDRRVLSWALGAALAGGAAWTVIALVTPLRATGVAGLAWPVGLAVVLAASIGAAVTSGRGQAGARAGLLAAVLSAPVHAAADLTAILQAGHFTLATAYDVAAYPHSGYPDVASYLLSDAMAGEIITGLVAFPLVLSAVALLAARPWPIGN